VSTIKEMWANGSRRFLLVIVVLCGVSTFILFMTGVGMIVLDWRVRKMWVQNLRMEHDIDEAARISIGNREQIKRTEDKIIHEGNDRWLVFQSEHPTFAVPIINPEDKVIDVKPAVSSPTPNPSPKVIVKQHTVRVYRKAPTPKPWWSR
jgi:hypothetical protein